MPWFQENLYNPFGPLSFPSRTRCSFALRAAGKQPVFSFSFLSTPPPIKFMECLMIGRDLVRLLQNVARIPEFELLWKDIIHNPQALSPQFTGK